MRTSKRDISAAGFSLANAVAIDHVVSCNIERVPAEIVTGYETGENNAAAFPSSPQNQAGAYPCQLTCLRYVPPPSPPTQHPLGTDDVTIHS